MVQQNQEPNRFELTGYGVQISYWSGHFIDEPNLPQFTYKDASKNLTFHRDQIRTEASELGTLVSVTLNMTVDAGATVLTLLLPSINLAGAAEQNFATVAIEAQSFGILPRKGARLIYNVLQLHGAARFVPFL
jgi:hypothetical protein